MPLLDTNVVSELMKTAPDATVLAWVDALPRSELLVTSITQAELLYGVALLAPGRRRHDIARAVEAVFTDLFRQRVLPFDSAAASAYAVIATARRRAGRPISTFDAAIAAVARSRGAALATRNTADFEGCGVDLINPWKQNQP
ncbi:MAG: type II toxin-antitoxin system VapC family toxin [Hyphomicrobiales bacterium]|nr:type II toxin-antitoxin system VapC family toxin [Hyphomicrobiales bacterium]MBV8663252.1 type II toxin-antitoxin system VapC family toxin [Hyphomicrobiales bacterium]